MSKSNYAEIFISHAAEDEGLAKAWRHLNWRDYTALNINDEPEFTRGLVEVIKIEDKYPTPEELDVIIEKPSTEESAS